MADWRSARACQGRRGGRRGRNDDDGQRPASPICPIPTSVLAARSRRRTGPPALLGPAGRRPRCDQSGQRRIRHHRWLPWVAQGRASSSRRGTCVGWDAVADQAHVYRRTSQCAGRTRPRWSVKPSAQPTLVRTQHLPPGKSPGQPRRERWSSVFCVSGLRTAPLKLPRQVRAGQRGAVARGSRSKAAFVPDAFPDTYPVAVPHRVPHRGCVPGTRHATARGGDAAHRVHARVEGGIRTGKDCGYGKLPLQVAGHEQGLVHRRPDRLAQAHRPGRRPRQGRAEDAALSEALGCVSMTCSRGLRAAGCDYLPLSITQAGRAASRIRRRGIQAAQYRRAHHRQAPPAAAPSPPATTSATSPGAAPSTSPASESGSAIHPMIYRTRPTGHALDLHGDFP